jgi:hypothetical protein
MITEATHGYNIRIIGTSHDLVKIPDAVKNGTGECVNAFPSLKRRCSNPLLINVV